MKHFQHHDFFDYCSQCYQPVSMRSQQELAEEKYSFYGRGGAGNWRQCSLFIKHLYLLILDSQVEFQIGASTKSLTRKGFPLKVNKALFGLREAAAKEKADEQA
jgi:hypothetical protein